MSIPPRMGLERNPIQLVKPLKCLATDLVMQAFAHCDAPARTAAVDANDHIFCCHSPYKKVLLYLLVRHHAVKAASSSQA